MTRYFVLADNGNGPVAIGPVSKDETVMAIRDEAEGRGWTLIGQAVEMSYREFREGPPRAEVPR
jgi:hypothetical protein